MIQALKPVAVGSFAGPDVEVRPVHQSIGEGVAFSETAHFAARVQVDDIEIHALGVVVGFVLGVIAIIEDEERLVVEYDGRVLHGIGLGEGELGQAGPGGGRRGRRLCGGGGRAQNESQYECGGDGFDYCVHLSLIPLLLIQI